MNFDFKRKFSKGEMPTVANGRNALQMANLQKQHFPLNRKVLSFYVNFQIFY